jgi:hypothetical protein
MPGLAELRLQCCNFHDQNWIAIVLIDRKIIAQASLAHRNSRFLWSESIKILSDINTKHLPKETAKRKVCILRGRYFIKTILIFDTGTTMPLKNSLKNGQVHQEPTLHSVSKRSPSALRPVRRTC